MPGSHIEKLILESEQMNPGSVSQISFWHFYDAKNQKGHWKEIEISLKSNKVWKVAKSLASWNGSEAFYETLSWLSRRLKVQPLQLCEFKLSGMNKGEETKHARTQPASHPHTHTQHVASPTAPSPSGQCDTHTHTHSTHNLTISQYFQCHVQICENFPNNQQRWEE